MTKTDAFYKKYKYLEKDYYAIKIVDKIEPIIWGSFQLSVKVNGESKGRSFILDKEGWLYDQDERLAVFNQKDYLGIILKLQYNSTKNSACSDDVLDMTKMTNSIAPLNNNPSYTIKLTGDCKMGSDNCSMYDIIPEI